MGDCRLAETGRDADGECRLSVETECAVGTTRARSEGSSLVETLSTLLDATFADALLLPNARILLLPKAPERRGQSFGGRRGSG